MKNLTHALALTFTFALAALIGLGCSCDEDEFNGKDACQKVVDATNSVLAECNEPPVGPAVVCGYELDACTDVAFCSPKVDVEACVEGIKKLECLSVTNGMYSVAACKDVQRNIRGACAPDSNYGGGDDD